jgi:uncharacterized membrane protein
VLSLQKIKLIIMSKENISKQHEASANDSSAMETENHSKNGASLKTFIINNKGSLLVMFGLLLLIFAILLFVSETQLPSVLLSSGILAVISAIVGVILTGAVTVFLLQHQSEAQKDLLDTQSETQRELLKK